MRRTTLLWLGILALLAVGCARRPPSPPAASGPTGTGIASKAPSQTLPPPPQAAQPSNAGQQTAAATKPAAGARPGESTAKPPKTIPPASHTRAGTPKNSKQAWKIPEGPLDEAKFIIISAKYILAVTALEKKKKLNTDTAMAALDAILKEANVTVSEYQAYADKVGRNEALKHRVREGILYQVAQHGGPKFLEPKAQLGKLTEIGRFRASAAKSGSQAHPKGKSDKQNPAPTTKARTGTSPGPRTPSPPTRPSSTTREPTGKSSEETAPQSDEKAPLGGSF